MTITLDNNSANSDDKKAVAMAAETLIITLMTVRSQAAIRIKTAIDSSLQTSGGGG